MSESRSKCIKILIIAPAWLGDLIMAQALFKELHAKYNCSIDVVAPEWNCEILACMPEVAQSIIMPVPHGALWLKKRYSLAKQLRANKYDWAIVLPNSWKSALVPFWAKIPKRTGWLGELRFGLLNDWRILNKTALPTMMQRYVALAYSPQEQVPDPHQYPNFIVNDYLLDRTLQKFQIMQQGQKILALCPGAAFGTAKRWPESYFVEVANQKIRQGWQIWLFGSIKDEPVVTSIALQLAAGNWQSFAGKLKLTETVALMSLVDVIITNDSGLMHLGSALNKYLLAIYGPTSPAFTPPFGEHAKIIQHKIACSPCFKATCPLQHHQCMRAVTPAQILATMAADGW